MKKAFLITWSVLFLLIGLIGCSMEALDFYDPDVRLFMKQLKAGTYNTKNDQGTVVIPMFTYKHVDELLYYADDMTEIPSFPLHTISSYYGGKPRLGECVLWIVESIRIGQPPSMGCKLVTKDALNYEGIYFLTNEQVLEAVSLYRQWWKMIDTQDSNSLLRYWPYDPLAESDYRWW
ncbi:DUF4943 domain-containing protein [Bacteroides sp. OttesenSCG-928-E20]|nr:DUF4943 domain-containing protein [Bacteroides sp. OttesenSCG-928-N06]MDL2299517.1 DUF4943 domain-containing protein [Bacteroides sp. OttesenSCG-928-E20]MDL2305740.1 DUF4943 domain-containing protein [Bacteroides sp. OttesenSCG-928-D19]